MNNNYCKMSNKTGVLSKKKQKNEVSKCLDILWLLRSISQNIVGYLDENE